MGIYLGLDSSTQGLSAICIDTDKNSIIYEKSVNFGNDLPEYKSPNGFLEHSDPLIKHADPIMWIDALDRLFTIMKKENFNFSAVEAVSGSGQQHGSVYLNNLFLDPKNWMGNSLKEIFTPMLSRKTAPIWMDSSTTEECNEIADTLGGKEKVCEKTGSVPIERFTGPQIRKFYKQSPKDYENTAVIHLVSSFMASVLAGKSVNIDTGDGAGMNLLNLKNSDWDSEIVNATAPDLLNKLPKVAPSNTIIPSGISDYFVDKYGFSKNCKIALWTGDNPSSLVGLAASRKGTAVISLGTSDTFMAAFDKPVTDPNGFGHVFGNPDNGFMCLICFKNGSLAREKIKEEFNLSWHEFDVVSFEKTQPGNNANVMLPFYFPEITPKTNKSIVEFSGEKDFIERTNPHKAVRAIIESQMLNIKIHSSWIGENFSKIKITGGASKSDTICQTAADIFQTPVERFSVANSAGLGAALRAAGAHSGKSLSLLAEAVTSTGKEKLFTPNSDLENRYVKNEQKLIDLIKEKI
jgi:xylulokinase